MYVFDPGLMAAGGGSRIDYGNLDEAADFDNRHPRVPAPPAPRFTRLARLRRVVDWR
jgi:hypothetical protein